MPTFTVAYTRVVRVVERTEVTVDADTADAAAASAFEQPDDACTWSVIDKSVEGYGDPRVRLGSPGIRAECHSDDRKVEIVFDAAAWFEQASDEAILKLAACGWRGDYPADWVAEFFAEGTTRRLFAYISIVDCGFECSVDETQAMPWLEANRPRLHARIVVEPSQTI